MSLDNFSRGMQEREGISILRSPGAQGVWEAVDEKHHMHRGVAVQVLPISESLGAREDRLEHSVLEQGTGSP